ncbi:hypothetical protein NKH18_45960 [Streptomyces sp. M10(2022)]
MLPEDDDETVALTAGRPIDGVEVEIAGTGADGCRWDRTVRSSCAATT